MNKFNFNSIDNLEIPDSWAEKAIENARKPKVVPVAKTTKILAFVASLVLVCGISVALFFMTNENAIPPVLESRPTGLSVNDETLSNQLTDGSSEGKAESEKSTTSAVNDYETIEPDEESTTSSTEKPTDNKKPSADSTKPHSTQKPTDPQQTQPDDTKDPPVPTEKPSVPPIEKPTHETIQFPSDEPTEKTDPNYISVGVSIYKHLVLDDGKIYCKVYDENGVLLGDSDVFSNEHLTQLTFSSYYMAYYYPYRYSLISKSGNYTFVFYNSNGEVAREVTRFMECYEP